MPPLIVPTTTEISEFVPVDFNHLFLPNLDGLSQPEDYCFLRKVMIDKIIILPTPVIIATMLAKDLIFQCVFQCRYL